MSIVATPQPVQKYSGGTGAKDGAKASTAAKIETKKYRTR